MSLLERRRILMNQNESLLPSRYIQVEYIESTGTQWIDTGFMPNGDTTLEIDYQLTDYPSNCYLYGVSGDGTSNYQCMHYIRVNVAQNRHEHALGNQLNTPITNSALDTNRHIIKRNKSNIYFDSTLMGHPSATFDAIYTMEIFARNSNGTVGNGKTKMKLYSFKIYDNGTLVRDFIPCYRKADGAGGLYDLVEGKFYENQGTGDFLLGSRTLPKEYQAVDYIESTGTQWIDTGIIANGNTKVDLDFQIVTITAAFMYGSRVSTSKDAYTLNVNGAGNLVSLYGSGADGYGASYTLCVADTKRHTVNKNHRSLYLDGVGIGAYEKQTFITPGNLELFACYNNGTKGYLPSQMRLYSCAIYDGVTQGSRKLLRDFIPCYRKSDGKVGLYDFANDKFYGNSGTGEFIMGTPKIDDYQFVEYIESTGQEYIDTGIKSSKDDTEIYIKFANSVVDGYFKNAFGASIPNGGCYANIFFYNNRIYCATTYNNTTNLGGIMYEKDKISEYVVSLNNGIGTVNLDGEIKSNSYVTDNSAYPYYIFTSYPPKSNAESCKMKLYRCRITRNAVVVRDFIPCYRKNDDKTGLYDLVEGKFYANQGTGEFLIGGEI